MRYVMGNIHQGQVRSIGAGMQCTVIAVAALVCGLFSHNAGLPRPSDWNAYTLDGIITQGSALYDGLIGNNIPRLIGHDELPEAFEVFNGIYQVTVSNDIYHGVVGRPSDLQALSTSLPEAIFGACRVSDAFLFTAGGMTVSVFLSDGQIYLMDSHARNRNGQVDGNGKAVLLNFQSIQELASFLTSTYMNELFNLSPVDVSMVSTLCTRPSSTGCFMKSKLDVEMECQYNSTQPENLDFPLIWDGQPFTASKLLENSENFLGSGNLSGKIEDCGNTAEWYQLFDHNYCCSLNLNRMERLDSNYDSVKNEHSYCLSTPHTTNGHHHNSSRYTSRCPQQPVNHSIYNSNNGQEGSNMHDVLDRIKIEHSYCMYTLDTCEQTLIDNANTFKTTSLNVSEIPGDCIVPQQALNLFLEQLLVQTVTSNNQLRNEIGMFEQSKSNCPYGSIDAKYLKEISSIPSLVCSLCERFLFPDQKHVLQKDCPSLCVKKSDILCNFCYRKALKSTFSYRSVLGNNLYCSDVPKCLQGLTLVEKRMILSE